MFSNEDAFFKELLSMFIIEAEEHVKTISSGLLELEKTKSGQKYFNLIETVYREAHSLKGAARAVNLIDVETVCQSMETIFAAIKKQTIALNPEIFDVLHQGIDIVSEIIETSGNADISEVMHQLTEIENRHIKKTLPPPEDAFVEESDLQITKIDKKQLKKFAKTNSSDINKTTKQEQTSKKSKNESKPVKDEPGVKVTDEKKDSPVILAPVKPRPIPEIEKALVTDTIRISVSKLDSLMIQAEEMLAVKLTSEQNALDIKEIILQFENWEKNWKIQEEQMRLEYQEMQKQDEKDVESKIKWLFDNLGDLVDLNQRLIKELDEKILGLHSVARENAHSLGIMVDNLLDDMKQVLMLPFSTLLRILPKVVRDLSREQSKDVELIVRGSTIEIDRRILEELKDPFIHLLRNCVDHGIEKPEVRIKSGKPKGGNISISISQLGGNKVEILVQDDGAGIDPEKVKESAIQRGVIGREEAKQLSDSEAQLLIFQSEVSTSPIITDISGRGLGMSIVREKVEKLGGSLTLDSQVNKGSTLRIELPVTMATFRGILIRVSDRLFVLPTGSVERAIRVHNENIKTVENHETISLEGEVISLSSLGDILKISSPQTIENDQDYVSCIILAADDKRIAFLVDEVVNEQEVLVKSLGHQLVRIANISGATILGNGKVVPILNASDLIKSAALLETTLKRKIKREDIQLSKKRILVAEDSITSRTLLKNILESAGYAVTTTVDGMDALTTLKTNEFDLVVSDIEMPRMNGFDLVSKIRSEKKTAELPVVLVTALESREDRERGIDVGANAYIVKRSFDQSNLLDVIRKLI